VFYYAPKVLLLIFSLSFVCFYSINSVHAVTDESGGRTVKIVELDSLTRMNKQALLQLISDNSEDKVKTGNFSIWQTHMLIIALTSRRQATLNLLERMSKIKKKEGRDKLLTGLIKSMDRQVANAKKVHEAIGEKLILSDPKEYGGRYGLNKLIWFSDDQNDKSGRVSLLPNRKLNKAEKNYVKYFLQYRDLLWFREFLNTWKKRPAARP